MEIRPLCKHAETVQGCKACHLFATSEGYRQAVAKLAGQELPPGPPAPKKPSQPMPKFGAGTELKNIFRSFGIPPCSSCAAKAAEMDRQGLAWCREHFDE